MKLRRTIDSAFLLSRAAGDTFSRRAAFLLMRLTIVACFFPILGFTLGWFIKPPPPVAPTPRKATAAAPDPLPAASSPMPVPNAPLPVRADARIAQQSDEIRARRQALQTLQKANRGSFRLGGGNERLPAGLAEYLLLSPEETAAINAALLAAAQTIRAAQLKGASVAMSADGATCLIDIPAIDTAHSAAEYDRLATVMRTVMGSERLALFNELAGPRFENIYDNFGLKSLRYEITIQLVAADSMSPLLRYQRHDRGPTVGSTGTSSSTVALAQIEKLDPLLFQLLPPAIKQSLSH